MTVAAAANASLCLTESFIVSSVWSGLLERLYRPPNRVDADTKTQGQSLDDGLSRVGHTNCECELAQLVQEECGDDGRDRETTTAKQRRSAENDHGYRRQEQGIALECRWFTGNAGHEHARRGVEQLGIDIGQELMKPDAQSHGTGSQRIGADRLEAPSGNGLLQDEGDHQQRGQRE